MRQRVLGLVDALRGHEVPVSVAESLDAIAAVAIAGVERDVLREALATTLVKDEHDRPTFDELFEEAFPLVRAARGARRAKEARAGGGASSDVRARGASGGGGERSGGASTSDPRDRPR